MEENMDSSNSIQWTESNSTFFKYFTSPENVTIENRGQSRPQSPVALDLTVRKKSMESTEKKIIVSCLTQEMLETSSTNLVERKREWKADSKAELNADSPTLDVHVEDTEDEDTLKNDSEDGYSYQADKADTNAVSTVKAYARRKTDAASTVKVSTRTNYKPAQVETLKKTFKKYPYPDKELIHELSKKLNIPDNKIKVWFQNKRACWRKKTQCKPGCTGDMTQQSIHPASLFEGYDGLQQGASAAGFAFNKFLCKEMMSKAQISPEALQNHMVHMCYPYSYGAFPFHKQPN